MKSYFRLNCISCRRRDLKIKHYWNKRRRILIYLYGAVQQCALNTYFYEWRNFAFSSESNTSYEDFKLYFVWRTMRNVQQLCFSHFVVGARRIIVSKNIDKRISLSISNGYLYWKSAKIWWLWVWQKEASEKRKFLWPNFNWDGTEPILKQTPFLFNNSWKAFFLMSHRRLFVAVVIIYIKIKYISCELHKTKCRYV